MSRLFPGSLGVPHHSLLIEALFILCYLLTFMPQVLATLQCLFKFFLKSETYEWGIDSWKACEILIFLLRIVNH